MHLINWIGARHGWALTRDWIEFSPGVVPALNICTLAYTDHDSEIIIQPPVYTPFHGAVKDHGRRLLYNNSLETPDGWVMDFDGLEKMITPATRMIIISNPHNPVGRVWRRAELERLVDICYEKGIVILSDEIHSDLILPGNRHIPVASLSGEGSINNRDMHGTKQDLQPCRALNVINDNT
ncbi:MAG: aminotransferase class I/II-fold pyridoxal phosphate-dependent enzyme [Marinilabiliales bacterium]|nr:aminotransferase class I/II-fold pyridoxal phosphate-dependent enzyme [Marinilabiliales bacterium]